LANKRKTLAELGEDALVDLLVAGLPLGPDVVAGAGDDCAVLRSDTLDRYRLLKADCVVEGVHYLADTPPSAVGYKAIARAASDIAAMGGTPEHALVTLILEPSRSVSYARGLYRGIAKAATQFGISVVGGETARPAKRGGASISIALTGSVTRKACCLRSGGKPGHRLYVTGRLGGSIAGRHLRFVPRLEEARWLAQTHKPGAMMDLSDGLAADLPRLAKASGCGYQIDPDRLPRHRGCSIAQALGDGEDYELLFSIPKQKAPALESAWAQKFPKLRLTHIGQLAKPEIRTPALDGGWSHF
jgi:thiamine-monophosphate kinase